MSSAISTAQQSPTFRQSLGLFDATMLVIGTIIGSGIFVVSAEISRDVGASGWLLAVWVVTGLMTIMGALSYAELAGMMPHAGGQYVFLREAFGPLPGFLYGWTCFLIIQTGSVAAVAVVFAKYLGVFVPALGTDNILFTVKGLDINLTMPVPWLAEPLTIFKRDVFTISAGQLVGVGVIAFLSGINCTGVDQGKWVQNVMTVLKTLALVILIALGLTVVANPESIAVNTSQPWDGMDQTPRYRQVMDLIGQGGLLVMLMVAGASMTGSLFSADAWNNITFTAGEIKNPSRTLPASLALGTGTVIVIYLLTNLAYMAVLPVRGDARLAAELATEFERAETPGEKKAVEERYAESVHQLGISHARDDRVGTAVLQQASPRLGVSFMAAAIMISTFGSINGMILMGARLYYAMARDKLFFQSVGILNGRGVPAVGLILQGLWAIALVFTGTYNELLDFVMFTVLIFYVVTVLGLFVLRWTRPDLPRPYRVIAYPVMPALYVVLCAAISFNLAIVKPETTFPGLILTLLGIPVFFFWRWRYADRLAATR